MQAPDSADECLDPALMSAFEDGAVDPFGQWHCADADAGPPSPFDMSTIDPDLLALYPEQNGGGDLPADSPSVVPAGSPSPPPQEKPSAILIPGPPTADDPGTTSMRDGSHGESPPRKRVRFAPLPPHDPPDSKTQVSPRAERRATRSQSRKRSPRLSAPAPKKHTAIGIAKRTISDGTLVPPSPCKRCVWEDEECLIKYPGAACNVCRRRGRKCELVDESVKYNGQRAKELRAAEAAAEYVGVA